MFYLSRDLRDFYDLLNITFSSYFATSSKTNFLDIANAASFNHKMSPSLLTISDVEREDLFLLL